jgi:putative protein-disulfide isomerase
MSSRLIYVMDPMCSWCWGFAPVVQALIEQAHARGVGVDLVVGGLRQERIAMDQAARERTASYWHAVHEASGQPFNFEAGLPEGLIYDTEPACRALVAARGLDAQAVWRLATLIQRAFYVDGRDVTLVPELVELAEAAGIPRIEFAESFDSQAVRDATAADFDWSRNLGIAGFPTLLAEHEGQLALVTNGFQPIEALSPLLARWLDHNLNG